MDSAKKRTTFMTRESYAKLIGAMALLITALFTSSSGECTSRTGRSILVDVGFEVSASGKLTYKIKSCESRRGPFLKAASFQIKDVVCSRIPGSSRSNCLTGKEVLTIGTTSSDDGCVNATLKRIAPGTAVTLVVNTKRGGHPVSMSFLLPEPPANAVADMEERKGRKAKLPPLDQSNYSRKKVTTRILAAN